jgi:hypothetical protein
MDDNVTVRIVGDASQVAPAVQQAEGSLGGLEGIIANINGWVDGLIAKFTGLGAAGEGAGGMIAKGMGTAIAATEAEGNALTRMILKVHEGAESVRTFQMRAKEFAEIYVAAFGIETIARWAEGLAEAAEKTEKLAATLGMTVPEVQGLAGAAQMSGTNIDALSKALGMMDNKALQSTGSTSSVTKAFRAMGVSADDGRTNMQRLLVIADKFHEMADGPTKAALAMQLFGRSGRDAIPFLNQGAAAIEQLMQKSKELGAVNEEAVEQGARLATSVNEAKVAWEGLKNTLTQAFGPILTELVDGFVALVGAMKQSYDSGGIVKIVFDAISAAIEGTIEIVHDVGLAFSEVFQSSGADATDWGLVIKEVVEGVVDLFKVAIAAAVFLADGFIAAFDMIKAGGETLYAFFVQFVGAIEVVGTGLREFMQVLGKVCEDALMLHWDAIAADWNNGMQHVHDVVQQKTNEILATTAHLRAQASADFNAAMDLGKSYNQFVDKLFKGGTYKPPHDDFKVNFGGGTGSAPDISAPAPKGKKGKKGPSIAEELEAELEAKKMAWAKEQDAQGTFEQFSLQSEADFWAAALQRTDLGTKDKLEIEKKYLAARAAVKKEEISAQLDGYAQDLEAAGASWDKKLVILREEQAYITRMYGAESQEARKAAEAVIRAEREKARELLEIQGVIVKGREDAALAGVDAEEKNAEFEVAMGRKTDAQLLQQDKQFENERYQIRLQGLNESLKLAQLDPNTSPVKLREIYNQIEELDRQHQAKLTQIDQQATLKRTEIERNAIGTLSNSWATTLSKMMTLQEGWRDGVRDLYMGLVQTVSGALEQIIEKWLTQWLTSLIIGRTQESANNVASVIGSAGKAGAAGTASMAAAPFPINLTAPAFGASMMGTALGYLGLASAEGGDWNVKEGLYHLHEQEMVLPSWAAGPIRSMIGGSPQGAGGFGAQGGDVHLHYSPEIHERERTSLKQMLANDGQSMIDFLNRSVRAGSLKMQPA